MRHNIIFSILFVLFLTAAFRLYHLNSIPYGLNNDAAWEGLAAIDMRNGNWIQHILYDQEGWRGEGIIRICIVGLMQFFGNDPITIKLSTVMFGIGLVIPVFFLIRSLFSTQLAFLTAFFIATSGWHIIMSKSGWRAVCVPFFTTCTLYVFFQMLKKQTYRWYILGGILLAATLYTYDAARIVPCLIIFLLGCSFFSDHTSSKHTNGLLLFISACILTLYPLIFYAIGNWQNFIGRSDYLFVGHAIQKTKSITPLLENITATALLFTHRANGNDFFINEPLLDQPSIWLFPIGLFMCFWEAIRRKKPYQYMLFWFVAGLIPGILSIPNGNRIIVALPAIYFFVALGAITIIKALLHVLDLKENAKTCILILLCAFTIFITYTSYIGPTRREITGFYPETLAITNHIKTIRTKYNIIVTKEYPWETLSFLLYETGDPFQKTYQWVSANNFLFDPHLLQPNKGIAIYCKNTRENNQAVTKLFDTYPNITKHSIFYAAPMMEKVAGIVFLIPPKK
jgi:4-amino-4-deoxy-L-arabinose transferase-like glycosyltransferase